MISNQQQLESCQSQAKRLEDSIAELRNTILPKNAKTYTLMAESYVEQLRELRADIDEYLGLHRANAFVEISLEGPNVALGRLPAALVTKTVDRFRKGMQSVVATLMSDDTVTAKRKPQWVERMCAFPLSGLAPGSVRILLTRPSGDEDNLFSDTERDVLDETVRLVFRAIEWVATSSEDFADTGINDRRLQRTLLTFVDQLLPPTRGDVQQIRYSHIQMSVQSQTATLSRSAAQRVKDATIELAHALKPIEKSGVVRRVDLDRRTFFLRDDTIDANDSKCVYTSEIEDLIKESLDQFVTVWGVSDRQQQIQVHAIKSSETSARVAEQSEQHLAELRDTFELRLSHLNQPRSDSPRLPPPKKTDDDKE